MYAIIDLETTGGQPTQDRITEIAIYIHDGEKIVDEYATLLNPGRAIPPFISQLTGITNDMVSDAPKFHEVARKVVEMTEGCVFVAHNVRFDYSFLKKEFADLGYNYSRKTLCTVRLSRSLIPGQPSYSLGKLCQNIGIPLESRHRAAGDAHATALLFGRLLKITQESEAVPHGTDTSHTLARVDALAPAGRRPRRQSSPPKRVTAVQEAITTALLPPLVSPELVASLPQATGVYYFHNEAGEVIYVGKSINIYKRIQQHFAIDVKSRKSLEFKNSIADITWELTGSELVALLYESHLIKQLKPAYNRAQRRSVFPAGIYLRTDEDGYKRLAYGRADARNAEIPIIALGNQYKAQGFLYHKVAKYQPLPEALRPLQNHRPVLRLPGASLPGRLRGPGAARNLQPARRRGHRLHQLRARNLRGHRRRAARSWKKPSCWSKTAATGASAMWTRRLSARKLGDFRDAIKPYNDNKDTQQIIRLHLRTKHKGEKVKVFA